MKKMLLVIVAMLASACTSPGPTFVRCTDAEVKKASLAIKIANSYFPDSHVILDDMKVFCKPEEPYKDAECVTNWYGTGPLYPGKMTVQDIYIGECILHESNHYQIWYDEDSEETCQPHKAECGWDWVYLESALDEFWAVYPQEKQ